ncbi:ParB/RepB/Spo0J family partition protein [Dictyobacter arantiisoli]|nr:ParB/RepB/Spo0J family partition protein [Dictyobacter arantiisoli]
MVKPKKKINSIFASDFLNEDMAATAVDGNALYGDLPPRLQEMKEQVEAITDGNDLPHIAIELLHDNPYQPRRRMNEQRLTTLSLEISQYGFRGVLLARRDPNDAQAYQLVYGHRRREAAKQAGLQKLPVMIQEITDQEMMFLAANENLMRDDLSPIDEAYMFRSMGEVLTQEQIAERLQVSRGYIRNRLELLKAPEDVQDMVEEKPTTIRAAYFLKNIEDSVIRTDAINALLAEDITGSEVEAYVENLQQALAEQAKQATLQAPIPLNKEQESEGPRLPWPFEKDEPDQTVQPVSQPVGQPVIIQPIVEKSKTESIARREQSKLETIVKHFENYEKRLQAQQRVPSAGEQRALQKVLAAIEHLRQNMIIEEH